MKEFEWEKLAKALEEQSDSSPEEMGFEGSEAKIASDAKMIWETAAKLPQPEIDINDRLAKINARLTEGDVFPTTDTTEETPVVALQPKSKVPYLKVAASVALLLAVGLAVYFNINSSYHEMQVATLSGETKTVNLPDGSSVVLNSGSSISYPENFSGNIRPVTLSGEAFFQVAKNAEQPFVITTKNTRTKVLGTSFNVRAYENEETATISVKTGKVSFSSANEEVILVAGNGAVFNKESESLVKKESNQEPRWQEGIITFKNTKLSEVFGELARKYNITFNLDNLDEQLLEQTVTASFDNKPIEETMLLLSEVLDIKYQIEGKTVSIL